jgi:hypothetical protein
MFSIQFTRDRICDEYGALLTCTMPNSAELTLKFDLGAIADYKNPIKSLYTLVQFAGHDSLIRVDDQHRDEGELPHIVLESCIGSEMSAYVQFKFPDTPGGVDSLVECLDQWYGLYEINKKNK